VLSSKASFEFSHYSKLFAQSAGAKRSQWRRRDAALRAYEKLKPRPPGRRQPYDHRHTKNTKASRRERVVLRAEMKALRAACNERALAKAAARN